MPCKLGKTLLKPPKYLILPKMLLGVEASADPKKGSECLVIDQRAGGTRKQLWVGAGDDEAAGCVCGLVVLHTADHLGDLCSSSGDGKDWAATGEHARKLRRHHKVRDIRLLWQQVDVGKVEQIVEALGRLQRKEGNVLNVGDERLESWAESTITAEDEVHSSVRGENLGKSGKDFEALLVPHIARVEKYDLALEIQLLAKKVWRG